MTSHGQRGLQLLYNFINLPSVVSGILGAVTYSFSADGTKVAVEDNSGNGYQYMGSLIYAKSGSTLTLESARFAHGYIAPQDGQVYYHTTDHLGSVRAITNMQGSVVERNGYYPFGSETALGSSYPKLLDNRMKFNGKEVQTIGNLGLLDYGARMYDPAIGRWTAQDPLSEKYYSWSQYNYCVNNPVMFVDPDGKKIVIGTVWEESFPSWAKPAYFKKYQDEVQSHLTELKQYNNEIADVIQRIEDSDMIINIIHPTNRHDDEPWNGFLGYVNKDINGSKIRSGGELYYDPENDKTARGNIRPPIIGLVHELGHAINHISGNYEILPKKLTIENAYIFVKNEEISILLENIIRQIYKEKQRQSYFDNDYEKDAD